MFVVFVLAALSWITRSFFLGKFIDGLSDGMIAIIFAIVLFAIPSVNRKGDRLMDWQTAVKLPWGILLLFGGGLAIASGFVSTGLSAWVGSQLMGLEGVSTFLLIFLVAALVLVLTEITSNTATASMMPNYGISCCSIRSSSLCINDSAELLLPHVRSCYL